MLVRDRDESDKSEKRANGRSRAAYFELFEFIKLEWSIWKDLVRGLKPKERMLWNTLHTYEETIPHF
jgi:hypothetical protein